MVKKKMALEKMDEMRKWLEKNNLKTKSNFILHSHNNPAVLGFLSRNEILVEI